MQKKLVTNLKFIKKNFIYHKIKQKLTNYFLGNRYNYSILNLNTKKAVLQQTFNILKSLAEKNNKFLIFTYLKYNPEFATLQNYKIEDEWFPGFLKRFFTKPFRYYTNERRIFPTAVIMLNNKENKRPLIESTKLCLPTFSYTELNKKTYMLSDFQYPLSFKNSKHIKLLLKLIIIKLMLFKNLTHKTNEFYIEKALKKLNCNKKILKKIYKYSDKRNEFKYRIKRYLRRNIKKFLPKCLFLIFYKICV